MEFTTKVTDIEITSATSTTAEVQISVELSFYNAANTAIIPALQPSIAAPSAIAEDRPPSSRLVIERERLRITQEEAKRVLREEEDTVTSVASSSCSAPKAKRKKRRKN
jgi:hypothetical protein